MKYVAIAVNRNLSNCEIARKKRKVLPMVPRASRWFPVAALRACTNAKGLWKGQSSKACEAF